MKKRICFGLLAFWFWGNSVAQTYYFDAEKKSPGASKPAEAPRTAARKVDAPGKQPKPAARSYAPLSVFRDKLSDGNLGPEMVVIPAGSFDMGSPESESGRMSIEGPVTRISMNTFALGKKEVTQREWRQLMGWVKGCDECPIEGVSWDDAQQFIQKLNAQTGKRYRLPSEAEWEYACRGGRAGEKYCGGNDVNALGWYEKNSGGAVHPVGQKQANAYGLYDMSGNVLEWVEDVFHAGYDHQKQNGGRAWVTDVRFKKGHRMLRGGSWSDGSSELRSAYRGSDSQGNRYFSAGFRLARALP